MTKKSVADFDDDPAGLMSAALTGELDVDGALATLGGEPGMQEPVKDLPPEGEAEPAPPPPAVEPAVEPAEEGDGGEPAPENMHAEPAWIKDLPESAQAEARKLHQTTEGQRRALKRRADQLAAAEAERKDAIAVAVHLKHQMSNPTPDSGAPEPAPARPGLELEIDDQGNARIPVDRLNELIDRRAQEIGGRFQQNQARLNETGQYANKILADAGVSDATSQRFLEAIQYTQARLREAAQQAGRAPQSRREEYALLEESGATAELAARFGGMRVYDVYDVYDGARNPYEYGHRLTDITRRYQDAWGGAAAPARRSGPPSPIKDHPSSMARKGVGAPVGVQAGDSAAHDIANMPIEEALAMAKDPAKVKALFDKWEKEVSASRH